MVETTDLESQRLLIGPEGSNPSSSAEEYDDMPKQLGMSRDEDSIGYEKRNGCFAGDAGRQHMKVSKGR